MSDDDDDYPSDGGDHHGAGNIDAGDDNGTLVPEAPADAEAPSALDVAPNRDSEDEISDDDDAPRLRRRNRPKRLLVEEDPLAELDEFKDDLSDVDAPAPPPRNRLRRSHNSDDDEFMEDEFVSDDDDFMDKLQEKRFIASDDDGDFGYLANTRSRRRKRRRRPDAPRKRLTRALAVAGDDEDESYSEGDTGVATKDGGDDIQQELDDLYDLLPMALPIRHKLRERQEVNYTIPPPLPANGDISGLGYADVGAKPALLRRGRLNRNGEFRKLLFPTAGPFGGSDVVSLFGTNVPPGGIPLPGMAGTNQLMGDSDSSDDEIVAIDGTKSAGGALLGSALTKPVGAAGGAGALISAGGGGSAVGKVKNNLSDTDPLGVDMNIDFSAVGGLDNYINQLKEMVALPLLYPELYQNFAITPPRGVLFHGPPGTGKTLMARALAALCSTNERKITFYMRKGADCLLKWVGEAERQLRLLFEEAKKNQPAIIFFDEIDGLAPVRSLKQEQIHALIVLTLLALMDGMDNRGQVIVIGATNRPDAIDPALRRPGRFDREFYFPLPDVSARQQILLIHTRQWQPPLAPEFLAKLAELTKGYGGADLRALCTEAALNLIQRKYPQIYRTNDKLQVNPKLIKVIALDFMKALDKIVPSLARLTSLGLAPLPPLLQPLLSEPLETIKHKLFQLLPSVKALDKSSAKLTALDEAEYWDPAVNDADGGFARHQHLKVLERLRVCKPHLLVQGPAGNGQQYLGAAILNYLEGFQIQLLDVGSLLGELNRTVEAAIIQCFVEARRHQPLIIFIPNLDLWDQVVPPSAVVTLKGLLRTLLAHEPVLVLGISEDLSGESALDLVFGHGSPANNMVLAPPREDQRQYFFREVVGALRMKPFEFINDVANRPRRKLRKLPVVAAAAPDKLSERKRRKQQEYQDTKLKNVLKIRLAGLMDLFKNRYKRFKKPVIDDAYLVHLFEPIPENPNLPPYEVLYVKSDDPNHPDMIKELSTGKYYHNMDLDIIEERLWNGFYLEPQQFLKDIKMIVRDAKNLGDRERSLKAEEMLTNAQFAIDEFATPEFLEECKQMRQREMKRQQEQIEAHKVAMEKAQEEAQRAEAEAAEAAAQAEAQAQAEAATTAENAGLLESPSKMLVQDLVASEASNGTYAPSVDSLIPPVFDAATHPVSNGTTEYIKPEVDANGMDLDTAPPANVPQEHQHQQQQQQQQQLSAVDGIANRAPAEPVVDSTISTVAVAGVGSREDTPATVINEAEEEEEESEIEELELPDRQLIIDEQRTQRLFTDLIAATNNYTVDQLEATMAKLMDVVWSDRGNWDKLGTIENLESIVKTLNG